MKTRKPVDRILLFCILLLVLIGILMVFSSSFYYSLQRFNDPYYFFKKQVIWGVAGLVLMGIFAGIPYTALKKIALPGLAVLLILLVAVKYTPMGIELNGAKRWIVFMGITIMPGELAKFGVTLIMAYLLSEDRTGLKRPKDLTIYLGILVIVAGLIVKQPNLSTAITVFGAGFLQLFVAGLPLFYVFFGTGSAVLAGIVLIKTSEYRMARYTTFLDPFKDTTEKGYQVVQSLIALGSGGFLGLGMGESIQNKLYLPEPQNDFIFATIGEEFGYFGAMIVLLLFVFLIWRGVKIAINAPDRFGCYLAVGITATVGIQTIFNIAVATSSMPVTGVPLPFISYGGNSLSLLLAQMGVLLSISRASHEEAAAS